MLLIELFNFSYSPECRALVYARQNAQCASFKETSNTPLSNSRAADDDDDVSTENFIKVITENPNKLSTAIVGGVQSMKKISTSQNAQIT